ncbi:MAG: hypothetical protein ACRYG2_21230 [Janthinobacterium lividum]
MPDPLSADESADESVVRRRRFLRGGALAAVAAGGALVASASSTVPASAATTDLVLGEPDNDAGTATTGLTTSGASVAALSLTNPEGASLRLVPVGEGVPEYYGLPLGSVVNTDHGPFVSVVDDDRGSFLTYVVTGDDLAMVPSSRAFTPTRVWDSKAKKGTVVSTSSAGAVDSKGRLVKGHWVDVKVADTDLDTFPIAAFLTLGSGGSKKDGYLNVWAGGSRPGGTVSLSFLKGKTMTGASFAELALNRGKKAFTVRVYASQTTYVTVDVCGRTTYDVPGPDFEERSGQRAGLATAGRAAARAARQALR